LDLLRATTTTPTTTSGTANLVIFFICPSTVERDESFSANEGESLEYLDGRVVDDYIVCLFVCCGDVHGDR
jgi:hypothetical protein